MGASCWTPKEQRGERVKELRVKNNQLQGLDRLNMLDHEKVSTAITPPPTHTSFKWKNRITFRIPFVNLGLQNLKTKFLGIVPISMSTTTTLIIDKSQKESEVYCTLCRYPYNAMLLASVSLEILT